MNYKKLKRYIFHAVEKKSNLMWKSIHFFALYLLLNLEKLFKKSYNKLINYNYYNLLRFFNHIKNKFYSVIKNKFYSYIKSYKKSHKIRNYIAYSSAFILINIFIYINIPFFYNYNKSSIDKYCSSFEVQCLIDGKIKYTYFPSPRLNLENLIILNPDKQKLISANNVSIKIAIGTLAKKNNFKFTKVEIKNSEINFYLNNLDGYKKIINKIDFINPIIFKKSNINFFNNKQKKISTIKEANIKVKNLNDVTIKGIFLNDEIQINYEKNNKSLVLKLLQSNILAKINISEQQKEEKTIKGNVLLKKGKNRVRSVFTYKNDQIVFENGDIRNEFLNGKLVGYIKFRPFFDFDLDLDLKGFNFKRLYTYLQKLEKEKISKLLKINYKINGSINLSTNKIYSKYDLINSFESNIKFSNGNILIDKMLLNLGKVGAADITGIISTDKKYANFKFENNVYIDNKKYFRRKFSIFKDQKIFNSLFTAGTLDLVNFNIRFDEMISNTKFKNDEITYIEKEFNYYMLDDGIINFFSFIRLKEFIKSVVSE